jgi:hypothetical protein
MGIVISSLRSSIESCFWSLSILTITVLSLPVHRFFYSISLLFSFFCGRFRLVGGRGASAEDKSSIEGFRRGPSSFSSSSVSLCFCEESSEGSYRPIAVRFCFVRIRRLSRFSMHIRLSASYSSTESFNFSFIIY